MNTLKTHKDLEVWKASMDFVVDVYKITGGFPKSELYGLTSQLRRASVSLPSNIAEVAARKSTTEFIQFLYIALGSLAEIETQLEIARRLNYYSNHREIYERQDRLRRQISALINALKNKLAKSNVTRK